MTAEELTCKRKRKHKTRKDAKKALRGGESKYLQPYRCKVCGYWHNGHKRFAPEKLTKRKERVYN